MNSSQREILLQKNKVIPEEQYPKLTSALYTYARTHGLTHTRTHDKYIHKTKIKIFLSHHDLRNRNEKQVIKYVNFSKKNILKI